MNEITRIHLGRQPFTIAVDAHKELQEYLHAIRRRMGTGNEEVIKEIEMRMAELLQSRGVKGDAVILIDDVAYLKEQLGQPGAFASDEVETESGAGPSDASDGNAPHTQAPRRLFRDTEHAEIAGVAAGLGAFFGIDPTFVRLAFVLLFLAGGSSVPIYFILWLIIPEAKTPAEKLQMQGKPVTIESLKETIEQADVPGTARRVGRLLNQIAQPLARVLLVLTLIALSVTAGVLVYYTFWL